jgi:hypothetical protein
MFVGAWRGAILVGVLCIAYDTSGNVAPLEGGHGHLKFGAILVYMAAGAVVGLILEALAFASRARQAAKRASE